MADMVGFFGTVCAAGWCAYGHAERTGAAEAAQRCLGHTRGHARAGNLHFIRAELDRDKRLLAGTNISLN